MWVSLYRLAYFLSFVSWCQDKIIYQCLYHVLTVLMIPPLPRSQLGQFIRTTPSQSSWPRPVRTEDWYSSPVTQSETNQTGSSVWSVGTVRQTSVWSVWRSEIKLTTDCPYSAPAFQWWAPSFIDTSCLTRWVPVVQSVLSWAYYKHCYYFMLKSEGIV